MFTTEWHFGMQDFDEIRNIRKEVFINELHVNEEEEFDWYDGIAAHLLIRVDGTPMATARIYPLDGGTRLGRFAVLKDYRRQLYGDMCLRLLLYKSEQLDATPITVSAPKALLPFFAPFGFVQQGEPYMERGTEHVLLSVDRDKVVWDSACKHM